jgi:hypothetical protein
MPDEERNDSQSLVDKLIAVLEHKILRHETHEMARKARKTFMTRAFRGSNGPAYGS